MVHVALAGATGTVGREVVAELARQGKHSISVLTRRDKADFGSDAVKVAQVDYTDQSNLTQALKGVETVISFINDEAAQKALIDASVKAGAKRFAPSEWAMSTGAREPGSDYKNAVLTHLKSLNAEKRVLEYTLFQPGVFMNLIVWPKKTADILYTTCIGIDADGGHALIVEDGAQEFTFTTIQDTARAVAGAIGYEGAWPEIGGIVGSTMRYCDVLSKIEEYSGKPIERHVLKISDLELGKFESTWLPPYRHPKIPPEMADMFAAKIMSEWWLAGTKGDPRVPPNWNKALPDLKTTDLDTFLSQVYGVKK